MKAFIRKARVEDALAVWKIRNAAIRDQCIGHYSDDVLAIWTEGPLTDCFVRMVNDKSYVAIMNNRVVGAGSLDCTTGHLDAVFVSPDMTGQGIGRQIITFLETIAKQSGLTKLTLDSTLNAAPFYRKCGFDGEAVGTYQSPRGISLDCIPMTKGLPAQHRDR